MLLVVLGVVASGCLGLLPQTVDHEIAVVNDAPSTRTVHVTVERADSVLLGRTHRVRGGERWVVTSINASGEYRVVVSTSDGAQLTAAYSLPQAEGDRRSFLDVQIQAGGSLEKQLYSQA